MVPMTEDPKITFHRPLISFFVGMIDPILCFFESRTIFPSLISSNWAKTSETAKRPMSTGIIEKPVRSRVTPKVKRSVPSVGFKPTIESRSPKKPDRKPLVSDAEETLAIIVSPKIMSAKYSGGPNLRAIFASWGERKIRQRVENMPPNVEAIRATPIAFPASPFLASG